MATAAGGVVMGQPPVMTRLGAVTQDLYGRLHGFDFRATGRLVNVGAGGLRKSYELAIKEKYFPDALRILLEIKDPAEARIRLLFVVTSGVGKMTIDTGHAGGKAPEALPFERWGDGLQGSFFSYEDVAEAQMLWLNKKIVELPDAPYGGQVRTVLEFDPGTTDQTHYASIKMWIDFESLATVYEEKTLKGSGAVKEIVYSDMHKVKGMSLANRVEAKMRAGRGSSSLTLVRDAGGTPLEIKDFDPALLVKA